ncbi:MAG TPA: helix-turn-helix domain-containing protein [Candidatus Limnocylindria bacterium]|nr:helix-turn-helix domain-containing protein [Candidatus Limnocylindria bacterium]
MAISLAGRKRVSSVAIRDALARAVDGDAKVVRTPTSVCVVRAHNGESDPRADAERLRQMVGAQVADDLTAGVAGPKPGASGAHFALVQAEYALALGRGLVGEGRTIHFDELGPFCFVLNQPADDVRTFAERLLGPLTAEERNDDLFDTLEAYLRNSGSVNAVARQLFLHRNTVRHRLRRIKRLITADLDDPDTRLALQLAILGHRALEKIAS